MKRRRENEGTGLRRIRCAVYTRKSTEENLDTEFNSLDAQREAAEAFIASQREQGWVALPTRYDDGGFSGGSMERPGLQRLLEDVGAGRVDCVVVYKVDRLSRSLLDFARIIEAFDSKGVSFVSVTQQFNTTTSMGRLTLNILLSFAQFEREIIAERIRDKVASARRKGKYMGGMPPLGYDVDRANRRLVVNPTEAELVRRVFRRFVQIGSTTELAKELNAQGFTTKTWTTQKGRVRPGSAWNKDHIYHLLNNPLYLGKVSYKGHRYPGEQDAIVSREMWDRAHAILASNRRVRGNRTRASETFSRQELECDIWCAAFFWPLTDADGWLPTTASYLRALAEPGAILAAARQRIDELAERHRFFHWRLEFPDVFARGGFDCVLGNPPWERIKLQEQEFFASRNPEIARAPNKAARGHLIRELPSRNPALASEFAAALRAAEGESKFVRASDTFPLNGRGDVNNYALFAERALRLMGPKGRAGIVVPLGIATDDTTKFFFQAICGRGNLASLAGFINEARLFPEVMGVQKFCLLTLSSYPIVRGSFVVYCRTVEESTDHRRRFDMEASDFEVLNPNTRTCPVFRTGADAELTKAIYRRVPVLVREARDGQPEEDPWGVRFSAMFHMSNDSGLFKTAADFPGGVPEGYVPLYEGKMIWIYDHRAAGVRFDPTNPVRKAQPTEVTDAQRADPEFAPQPNYWVAASDVDARVPASWQHSWLLGFRDVTRNEVERTAIFSILPRVGVGNKIPLVLFDRVGPGCIACFLANVNSLPSDYVTRQKLPAQTSYRSIAASRIRSGGCGVRRLLV